MLKARNQAGFGAPPWVWTRRQIAARWRCRPSDVDREPWYEIQLELQLMEIEQETAEFRRKHHGKQG